MFTIGLGFRRGVSAAQIEAAIRAALNALPTNALLKNTLPLGTRTSPTIGHDVIPATSSTPLRDCIAHVASLDAKSSEPGLLAFCSEQQIGLKFFSRETLACLPGPSPASTAVQKRFGLDGICESAALAAMPEGTLLLRKTSTQGVSIAIVGVATSMVESSESHEDTQVDK